MIEDVLVKVDKFIFPVDFIVLDFETDKTCPLIFGRPFLNTSRALIDVHEGKVILRVGDESVEFVMSKLMEHPMEDEMCMKVEVMDECAKEVSYKTEANKEVKVGDEDCESKQENTFTKHEILLRSDNPIPTHLQYLPKKKKKRKERPKLNRPKQVKFTKLLGYHVPSSLPPELPH